MKYKLLLLAIIVSILNTGCSDSLTQTNDNTLTYGHAELLDGIRNGQVDGVIYRLGRIDYPNFVDEKGNTFLIESVRRCNIALVRSLLEIPGLELHIRNNRGEDAFMIAERRGCLEILELLRNHREGEFDDPEHFYGGVGRQPGQGDPRIIPPPREPGQGDPRIIPPPAADTGQGNVVREPVLPIPTTIEQTPPQRPVEIEKTENQDTTIARGEDYTIIIREPGADLVPVERPKPEENIPGQPGEQGNIEIEKTENQDTTMAVPRGITRPEVAVPVPDTTVSVPDTTTTNIVGEPGAGVILIPVSGRFIPIPPIELEVLEADRRQRANENPRSATVTEPRDDTVATDRRVPPAAEREPGSDLVPDTERAYLKERGEVAINPLVFGSPMDANIKDSFGRTMLMWAVEDGKVDLVRNLLESRATNVNARDNNGETALLIATKKGNDEIVKLLLTREDINVNAKDNTGRTPLMAAASAGYIEILYLLIVRPELDVNSTLFLEKETALLQAVIKRHITTVRILLTHENIDSSIRDYLGVSPIDYARRVNHKELISILEEHENKQD